MTEGALLKILQTRDFTKTNTCHASFDLYSTIFVIKFAINYHIVGVPYI